MHYKALFRAADWFATNERTYDGAWRAAGRIHWEKLHALPIEEVCTGVLGFLNQWRCRIPRTERLATRIKEVHRNTLSLLETVRDQTLEDINLEAETQIAGLRRNYRQILTMIFHRFRDFGDRFREVAASKTLHMIYPRLFVMWDRAIREAYGVTGTPRGYVSHFLPWMKREVEEAIATYRAEHGCSRTVTVENLNRYKEGKTLAKLLDEFNFMRYKRGLI